MKKLRYFSIVMLVATMVSVEARKPSCRTNSCDKPRKIRCKDIPFTITKSGVYCLDNDVIFNNEGPAIAVEADCVTILGNAHKITPRVQF